MPENEEGTGTPEQLAKWNEVTRWSPLAAPGASQRSDVGCSAWLDALRRHVDDMKAREREEARLRDEHRTRYEMVMKERMLLEDFIYKTERI